MSLLLGLAVISLGWSALAHQRTVASRLRSELDLLSARRLAAIVIGKELRAGVRGRDWIVRAPDRLSLRAFRGWGLVCRLGTEPGNIVVAYHGERAANPVKDSVLILTADGWQRADLTRRASGVGSCAMDLGGNSEIWRPGWTGSFSDWLLTDYTRAVIPTRRPSSFGSPRPVDSRQIQKAIEGVQRVAHMALVRVQTRNDDEA